MSKASKRSPQNQSQCAARRFWQRHIEKHRASGMSRAAYCREQGLSYHAMTYWTRRLAVQDERPNGRASFPIVPVATIAPDLLGCGDRQRPELSIHLSRHEVRIDVQHGCQPALLQTTLDIVRQRWPS